MPYSYRSRGDANGTTHSAREAVKQVLHCARCAHAILRLVKRFRGR